MDTVQNDLHKPTKPIEVMQFIPRPAAPPFFYKCDVFQPSSPGYGLHTLPIRCGGYPIVNIIVLAEGQEGSDFYVLVEYVLPQGTRMQITDLGSAQVQAGGIGTLQVAAYRPMLPQFNLIVASMSNATFSKIAVTVYATAA